MNSLKIQSNHLEYKDTFCCSEGLAHGVSILTSTKWFDIVEHVFEVLQREMGLIQIQFKEVTLGRNELHEELGACQRKCLGLEQEVIN
jgi:hypothetical protein